MRKQLLGSLATLLSGAGLILAQEKVPPPAEVPAISTPLQAPTTEKIVCGPLGLPPMIDEEFRSYIFWTRTEYLLWDIKDIPVAIPLVAVGGPANPGILGQPGTTVVMGDGEINSQVRHGGRLTLGCWIDHQQDWALEGNYFFLAPRTVSQSVSSSGLLGSLTLGIPFFDPTIPGNTATFLSDPPRFQGIATVAASTRAQGSELNLTYDLASSMGIRVDVLGGFRWLNVDEILTLSTESPNVPPPLDVFQTLDEFKTRNHFYGPQIGMRVGCGMNRCFLDITGKFAIGQMTEIVNINGALATNDFNGLGPVQVFPGAYFTQPTNIGNYHRNRFCMVPELIVNIGVKITSWARLYAGYNLLYVSDAARPGDLFDPYINPTQAPAIIGAGAGAATFVGVPRPTFTLHSTDFFAHGLNVGLELRF